MGNTYGEFRGAEDYNGKLNSYLSDNSLTAFLGHFNDNKEDKTAAEAIFNANKLNEIEEDDLS